jgi:Helix-turn-helix domain
MTAPEPEPTPRPTAAELAAVGAPVLYTPEEAAPITGKSDYWLKRKAGKGEIPHTRLGRTVMFSPADLSEIARNGARKPQAAPAAVTPIAGRRKRAAGDRTLEARVPRRKRGAA